MNGSESSSPYVCKDCGECVDALAAACDECDAVRPRGGWELDAFLGRTVLSRYRLERRIGRGSSSEVFLATDTTLPSGAGAVVVKTLPGAISEASRRRFVTEVRAIRRLHSPHVVRVYDAGIDAGVPCIVMEHLEGETLRSFSNINPSAASAASASMGIAIAKALGEAHAAGIVHRDLKPDNVFLCGADRFVKVLDFGAAAVLGPEATHSSIGTPRYMAPEQIEQRGVDARTDIYALGVVLFELLAQTPLFSGSVAEVLRAQLCEAPDAGRLAEHAPNPAFTQLVLAMLSKGAHQRPASMREVELQLTALRTTDQVAQPAAPIGKSRVLAGSYAQRWRCCACWLAQAWQSPPHRGGFQRTPPYVCVQRLQSCSQPPSLRVTSLLLCHSQLQRHPLPLRLSQQQLPPRRALCVHR
jgi:eukaryotic-like serine/threonine-protein kinase